MEPYIQRNADGRCRIEVRTPCVHNKHSGSIQAAQCGRISRSSITVRSYLIADGRQWSHWARVMGVMRLWYERRTDVIAMITFYYFICIAMGRAFEINIFYQRWLF